MQITNKHGLPEPLVMAIRADPYNPKSDFTTTGLLKPPRVAALERIHRDELTEDASDRIWALMGQLGHLVLERCGSALYAEKRHTVTRTIGEHDWTISGQVDLWNSEVLVDYKFTSIWAVKDGAKPEWVGQANINAVLCRAMGIEVKRAENIVILRDWSVGEARRDSKYPPSQCQVVPVPLWPAAEQEAFLMKRLRMHLDARAQLPACTDEERWARDEKWAIKKKGAARATKLCDSEDEALRLVATQYRGMEVEHRPAVQTRCLDYCAAAKFCFQFRQLDPGGWQRAQDK